MRQQTSAGRNPFTVRRGANPAHISHPRLNSGLRFQVKILKTCLVVPSKLASGGGRASLSDTMYSSTSFRKSTLPQDRQLIVYYY